MKIYTKQIDEVSLTAFVTGVAGSSLSGQLNSYLSVGGYLGVNVVYASGGFQIVSGQKTFDTSPNVPYSGLTGQVTSRLYVDNQILANSVSLSGAVVTLSGNLGLTGANLSAVKVTGSSIIQNPNFTGMGGTLVIQSGNFILISGAGAGGAANNGDGINLSGRLNASGRRAWDDATNLSGRLAASGAILSAVSITGGFMQTPNFTGMGGTLVIQSGNFVLISGAGGSAGASNNGDGINLSGNLNASGRRAWDDSTNLSGRLVASGAILSAVSITGGFMQTPNFTGMGGTLIIQSGNFVLISGGAGGGGNSNVSVTGSSAIAAPNFTGMNGTLVIQSGNFVLISGSSVTSQFITNNTYNITGTGTNNIYPTSSGSMTNTYNVSGTLNTNPLFLNGITGNFVNISFFFDETNLATGLNLIEGFVSRDFIFTGYAIGAYITGVAGVLTGIIYQRDTGNIKNQVTPFSFASGSFFTGKGGFNQTISGMNRIGIDIYRLLTGVTGVSIGIFGVGY